MLVLPFSDIAVEIVEDSPFATSDNLFNEEKIFIKREWSEIRKHSDKYIFYTLRFDCSFAAANTIKPQLL